LEDAVFGLASRYLIRIMKKRGCLGNTMPILRQLGSPILRLQLGIKISDHLASDPFVLDVRITVCEAAPLFPELSGGHFDFTSALNEFL
jgi:hypothetical protein